MRIKLEPNRDIATSSFDIANARFSIFGAGIKGTKPYMQGTLADVYQWMNSPRLADLTQQLRGLADKDAQRAFKAKALPFATFSGQFAYRNAHELIQHSGLQCFDFDGLSAPGEVQQVRDALAGDEYFTTELMFTSPSGNGVKWVTHVDLARGTHEMWYAAIREYLRRTYGLEADPAPANVASACFLCSDSNLVINSEITLR